MDNPSNRGHTSSGLRDSILENMPLACSNIPSGAKRFNIAQERFSMGAAGGSGRQWGGEGDATPKVSHSDRSCPPPSPKEQSAIQTMKGAGTPGRIGLIRPTRSVFQFVVLGGRGRSICGDGRVGERHYLKLRQERVCASVGFVRFVRQQSSPPAPTPPSSTQRTADMGVPCFPALSHVPTTWAILLPHA